MNIHFICVGQRMPRWVQEGYGEYAKRMPTECALRLIEIAPGRRGKGADIARALRDEGERMLAAIPKGCQVLALDVKGKSWDTEQLSGKMSAWMADGRDLALLVGGPEGLADACLQRAGALVTVGIDHAPPAGAGRGGRTALPGVEPAQKSPLSSCLRVPPFNPEKNMLFAVAGHIITKIKNGGRETVRD